MYSAPSSGFLYSTLIKFLKWVLPYFVIIIISTFDPEPKSYIIPAVIAFITNYLPSSTVNPSLKPCSISA